eukprot:sb/3465160/
MCDGVVDCHDMSDECNSACRRSVITNTATLVVSTIMGFLGVILSLQLILKGLGYHGNTNKRSSYVNRTFVTLIAVGDFLTSTYLLLLSAYHLYIGSGYCEIQLAWLSGWPCVLLGVISTTGATVTSLSMAAVSLFKVHGTTRALRYRRSREANPGFRGKISLIIVMIQLVSVGYAVVPAVPPLEDWFVNGVTFESGVMLFLGVMTKERLLQIVRGYHGNLIVHGYHGRIGRSVITDLSWTRIRDIVGGLFSSDSGGIGHRKISFYGNDPVCLFKYFVLPDDPQVMFVWGHLSLHFVCFVIVAVCHVMIGVLVRRNEIEGINRRTNINWKVSLICVTDFCCWMPFLICCALHTAEVVDMSLWYQVFSLNILPLNSVLNPLLHSDLPLKLWKRFTPRPVVGPEPRDNPRPETTN